MFLTSVTIPFFYGQNFPNYDIYELSAFSGTNNIFPVFSTRKRHKIESVKTPYVLDVKEWSFYNFTALDH